MLPRFLLFEVSKASTIFCIFMKLDEILRIDFGTPTNTNGSMQDRFNLYYHVNNLHLVEVEYLHLPSVSL